MVYPFDEVLHSDWKNKRIKNICVDKEKLPVYIVIKKQVGSTSIN